MGRLPQENEVVSTFRDGRDGNDAQVFLCVDLWVHRRFGGTGRSTNETCGRSNCRGLADHFHPSICGYDSDLGQNVKGGPPKM